MHCSNTVGPAGPILTVTVQESAAKRAVLVALGQTPAPAVVANLLVDTGASHTSLDDAIITKLGLQPTGSTGVLTPSTGATPHQVSLYDVEIVIPGIGGLSHAVPNLPVSGCNLSAQPIDGLLGRDVLAAARMTYSGPDNHFFLSF